MIGLRSYLTGSDRSDKEIAMPNAMSDVTLIASSFFGSSQCGVSNFPALYPPGVSQGKRSAHEAERFSLQNSSKVVQTWRIWSSVAEEKTSARPSMFSTQLRFEEGMLCAQ